MPWSVLHTHTPPRPEFLLGIKGGQAFAFNLQLVIHHRALGKPWTPVQIAVTVRQKPVEMEPRPNTRCSVGR